MYLTVIIVCVNTLLSIMAVNVGQRGASSDIPSGVKVTNEWCLSWAKQFWYAVTKHRVLMD